MRQLLLFLVLFSLFIGVAAADTITVGFSGDNPDYVCDGYNDDVQINAALAKVAGTGGTVYLKSGTYIIGETIKIGDNTILTGDSDAVVKLKNNARWDIYEPLIKNAGSKGNIKIHGFEVDGNFQNNNEHYRGEGSYYILIYMSSVDNVEVYDMKLHNNAFDLMRFAKCTDVSIHDNIGRDQGHEFVWIFYCNGVKIYNNDMSIQVNTGVRVEASKNMKIYNNKIYATVNSGYTGIYVQSYDKNSPVTSVEIYNNNIYNTRNAGIYAVAYKYGDANKNLNDKSQSTGLYIHDNVITNTGRTGTAPGGGISTAGFHNTIIEDNVIKDVNGNGISILYNKPALSYTGVVYYIRNNVITSPSGTAIKNYETSTHSIVTTGSSSPSSSGSSTQNAEPTAKINSINPTSATKGTSVYFSGSGTDTDGTIAAYKWRSSISGQISTSASFSSSTLAAGTHTIYFSVKDNDGAWSNEVSSTLTISGATTSTPTTSLPTNPDGKPAVRITSISPNPATVGSLVTLNGIASDSDGKIARYVWKSDRDGWLGSSTSSASFSTSKLSAGTHTIWLLVEDNDGKWTGDYSTLTIGAVSETANEEPVVEEPANDETVVEEQTNELPTNSNGKPAVRITSISPSPATVGSLVTFNGIASDADGKITRYVWKSDRDGWLGSSTRSASFSTSKLSAGTHTIWLLVEDNDGKWTGDRYTLTVGAVSETANEATTPTTSTPTASNQKPTVSITSVSPNPAKVGSSVSFKGTGSDPDGKIARYVWKSSRDGWLGSSTSSASFSTSKLSAGTHTIWLLVEDNDGSWTGTTRTLVVKS
jgi:hypothetical protein